MAVYVAANLFAEPRQQSVSKNFEHGSPREVNIASATERQFGE